MVVRWGKKEYDAVVLEVKSRAAKPFLVQFDKDNACAWLAPGAVRLMPEAEASALPGWLRVGKAVEAVDPLAAAGGAWHAATLEDARQGLDGVRLWLRYKKSGGGQWARLEHVRKPGTAAPAAAAAAAAPAAAPAPRRAAAPSRARAPSGSRAPPAPTTSRSRRRQGAAAAPAAEAPPPAAAEASGEAEGEASGAAEEEASGAAEAQADGDESESEEEFGENDAVVVRWGKKEHDAVVLEVKSRGARRVYVQFDNDNACAWVAPSAVRLMAEAEASALPGWLRVGKAVEAVDPLAAAGGAWHAATLEDARQGLAAGGDGVKLWLRYTASGGGQWARLEHVRGARHRRARRPRGGGGGGAGGGAGARQPRSAKRSAKLATRAAELVRHSARRGTRGLRGMGAASRRAPAADAYVVSFGDAEATAVELLAPGVVVARVPPAAPRPPAQTARSPSAPPTARAHAVGGRAGVRGRAWVIARAAVTSRLERGAAGARAAARGGCETYRRSTRTCQGPWQRMAMLARAARYNESGLAGPPSRLPAFHGGACAGGASVGRRRR